MKNPLSTIVFFAAVSLIASSCERNVTSGLNYMEKKIFDSWIAANYPDAERTTLGSYILLDEEGTGEIVGSIEDSPYLYGRYVLRDLDGTIQDYTDAIVAKQLGIYDSTYFYGPHVWKRADDGLNSGVEELIETMRVGGRRAAVVPGWLNTTTRYDTEEDYLNNITGENSIYDILVVDIIQDITQWEIDSTENYVNRYFPGTDSTVLGYYYKQTQEPSDTTSFESGATVYINYIGRTLDGRVFDTTIKDTAKFYGIYSPNATYEPTYVTWATTYDKLTMGENSSSTITGFSKAIFGMRTGETGTAIFISDYGYSYSGTGLAIPAYSPLRFDIELIGIEE